LRDADASNQLVVHTQEVLLSAESVLLAALEAQTSAQTCVETGNPVDNEGFTRTERATIESIDRLAALTADNFDQQRSLSQLRPQLSETLGLLRAAAAAKREGRVPAQADLVTANTMLDAARETLRTMRLEENRLLGERVQADRAAVRRLQWLSIGALTAAAALRRLHLADGPDGLAGAGTR